MKPILMALALTLSSATYAGTTDPIDTHAQETTVQTLNQAKAWGLSEQDWQRYETLMSSPQGHGLEKSNPITVLGRFARTPSERAKLAEALVHYEKKRVEGLLAFNRAYQSAWKRLYPTLKPIGTQRPDRVALFVQEDCLTCFTAYQQWRSQGVAVDVYISGIQQDDERLKRWAEQAGITTSDVQSGAVTLNHDDAGLAFSFSISSGRTFPMSAHRKGGEWALIDLP
ncbi:TIGR03759 family integrating conjugative element protein [Vibrio sp. 10N.261.46.A3]|uniref:TIGR03759 family integrating conjugative element protein n=1 Tax=Vibrio sp. 10N.261.46.A3 TaxID=3229658 RepID=UPI00355307D0